MPISDDDARLGTPASRALPGPGKEALIYGVTFLLMLWPLAVSGAPFYSADSSSYLRGGAFGFNTGLLILDHWWQSLFGAASTAATSKMPSQALLTLLPIVPPRGIRYPGCHPHLRAGKAAEGASSWTRFGGPAVVERRPLGRPVTLRRRLSVALPLSESLRNYCATRREPG